MKRQLTLILLLLIVLKLNAQYSPPANQLTEGDSDYISHVTFNTINLDYASIIQVNNGSGHTSHDGITGYGNYTGTSTGITVSSSYTLTVEVTWSEYAGDKLWASAWFDWNHDYDFTDGGEETILANAVSSTGAGTYTFSSSITVPTGAEMTSIRMRIRMISAVSAPTMTNFAGGYYGEIEDYTINVSAAAQQ